MEYLGVELKSLFHYKYAFILLLFRFGYIFFSRKRFKFIKGRVPRPSFDAIWFLPVFIWGIESLNHMVWWDVERQIQGFEYYQIGRIEHGFFSALIFLIIIGLCLLQEYLARYVGIGVRENQSTIPISLIVVFLSVISVWILVGFNLPFPPIV